MTSSIRPVWHDDHRRLNFLALLEKQLHQMGAILAGDAGDQGSTLSTGENTPCLQPRAAD